MYSRYFILVLALFLLTQSQAQDCNITVNGKVIDEGTQTPLSYVNVYIQETQQGAITEEDGSFVLEEVCHGEFHFIFSHLGCEAKKYHYHIDNDTTIIIALSHSPINLGTVVIGGQKENYNNQPNLSVKRQTIEDNSNLNLSGILELESGIHLIKNGSGISKPVVQGLYGNRLAILNNGIQQSGQQWGNDHSPEIDPFSADKITIIKGASALEYGSGNLGSVILTEPKKIKREPHLHGQANYIFESNGKGHTLNARIAKYSPVLAWKINGTLKKYGDRKTPDYFLNNTGAEEANLSLQLEKSWNENLFFDFYASTFNTQLGILRGSHIGNLTDLEDALTNDVPFFTEPNFSYEIDAPRQRVGHHLIKAKAKYFLNDEDNIEVLLAGQINDRKEFDVRRNNLSDTPSLSLFQTTINAEAKYTKHFNDWEMKLGNQNIITDNNNQPGTGILPLIPNYTSLKSGLFTTLNKSKENLSYNFGLRYDYENQTVLQISQSIPREILRFENNFHNVSGLITIDGKLSKTQSLSWNIGFAMRNPAVNEFYSNGLHQGVSGIEEGDPELNTEEALKNSLEYKWIPSSNFTFNALAYHQAFNDYIFLNPQDEFRLTIRGSFPVFRYEQADASIYGLDLSTQFNLGHALLGKLKYSYIRGRNRDLDIPLVFIPPNNFSASLTYRVHNSIRLSKDLTLDDTEIELTNRYVFRQNNILPEQDFAPTPSGYNLIGFKMSTNLIVPNYKFRFFIKVENLLDTRYRDYLNRQRYFADDLGRSISVGINFKF